MLSQFEAIAATYRAKLNDRFIRASVFQDTLNIYYRTRGGHFVVRTFPDPNDPNNYESHYFRDWRGNRPSGFLFSRKNKT